MRVIALLAIAAPLLAQSFEVASVKRSNPESGNGAGSTGAVPTQQEPGRINYPNVKLKGVIALAYGVDQSLVEGPQWLDDERYNIIATLPKSASQADIPAMLQHLLAERFGMTVRVETRNRTGFALVRGKGPLKMKLLEKEAEGMGFQMGGDHVELHNMTMAQFAKFLSGRTNPPVFDETGIEGRYDMTLNASWTDVKAGLYSGAVEDLGLKHEKRTVPAKFVIVDKANKIPTGN